VAKKDVVSKLGIYIDVWIDDSPFFITHSFKKDEKTGLWL